MLPTFKSVGCDPVEEVLETNVSIVVMRKDGSCNLHQNDNFVVKQLAILFTATAMFTVSKCSHVMQSIADPRS